jgi:hypothetical protein
MLSAQQYINRGFVCDPSHMLQGEEDEMFDELIKLQLEDAYSKVLIGLNGLPNELVITKDFRKEILQGLGEVLEQELARIFSVYHLQSMRAISAHVILHENLNKAILVDLEKQLLVDPIDKNTLYQMRYPSA